MTTPLENPEANVAYTEPIQTLAHAVEGLTADYEAALREQDPARIVQIHDRATRLASYAQLVAFYFNERPPSPVERDIQAISQIINATSPGAQLCAAA